MSAQRANRSFTARSLSNSREGRRQIFPGGTGYERRDASALKLAGRNRGSPVTATVVKNAARSFASSSARRTARTFAFPVGWLTATISALHVAQQHRGGFRQAAAVFASGREARGQTVRAAEQRLVRRFAPDSPERLFPRNDHRHAVFEHSDRRAAFSYEFHRHRGNARVNRVQEFRYAFRGLRPQADESESGVIAGHRVPDALPASARATHPQHHGPLPAGGLRDLRKDGFRRPFRLDDPEEPEEPIAVPFPRNLDSRAVKPLPQPIPGGRRPRLDVAEERMLVRLDAVPGEHGTVHGVRGRNEPGPDFAEQIEDVFFLNGAREALIPTRVRAFARPDFVKHEMRAPRGE